MLDFSNLNHDSVGLTCRSSLLAREVLINVTSLDVSRRANVSTHPALPYTHIGTTCNSTSRRGVVLAATQIDSRLEGSDAELRFTLVAPCNR